MGYLRNLRDSWRVRSSYSLNKEPPLTSTNFISRFGMTARFEHVGLDSRPRSIGQGVLYDSQLFAVFSGSRDQKPLIPFSVRELDELALTLHRLPPGYTKRDEIVSHLQREIDRARVNIEAHKPTLARLNPEAAKFLAQLN